MNQDPLWAELEHCLEMHHRSLYGLAISLSESHDLADDLVQEALANTYRARREIGQPENSAGYLARTIINLSRRAGTQRARSVDVVRRLSLERPQTTSVDQVADADSGTLRAVRRLPARQREVVLCRYWLDLSVDQTASLLEIAPGTVKAHTFKAIKRLKAEVTAHGAHH